MATRSPTKPKGGRPAKTEARAVALEALDNGDASTIAEAAELAGVGVATVMRAQAERAASGKAPAIPRAAPSPRPAGGADLSGRAETILRRRRPSALAELVEGLGIAEGPTLEAWLERPFEDVDPLAVLEDALPMLRSYLASLDPGAPKTTAAMNTIISLGKAVEQIRKGRRDPLDEDQVLKAQRALDESALPDFERNTEAQDRALQERMGRIKAWGERLGPGLGEELGKMLEGLFEPV